MGKIARTIHRIQSLPSIALTSLRQPKVLSGQNQHIILLSHMRGYTSLLSHIMGSHPEISGYSELHIPYHFAYDLTRMRCTIYNEHKTTPPTPYYFDKIINHELAITQPIINRNDVHLLFMLRPPLETIRSIVNMYQNLVNKKKSRLADPLIATNYYVKRLDQLSAFAHQAQGKGLFIDGEALIQDTASTLGTITNHLSLNTPLSEEYTTFPRTGQPGAGDPSANIHHGKIVRNKKAHEEFTIPDSEHNRLHDAYATCKETLLKMQRKTI